MSGARRFPFRVCHGYARRARLMLCFGLAVLGGGAAVAQEISEAEYLNPTAVYPHGVLGDELEWETVRITVRRFAGQDGGLFQGHLSRSYDIHAPDQMVFEDIAPRLWDVDGDGTPEVVVILSHQSYGAQLAVIGHREGEFTYIAATPTIGQRFRWLAPVGAADLDGDGHIEIALVVTPHLGKTLHVWRYRDGDFREVASRSGLTNHKIGWDFIAGGLRDCGAGPEIITADSHWQSIMASSFAQGEITTRRVDAYGGPDSLTAALNCP